jgi:hypothetical protein
MEPAIGFAVDVLVGLATGIDVDVGFGGVAV